MLYSTAKDTKRMFVSHCLNSFPLLSFRHFFLAFIFIYTFIRGLSSLLFFAQSVFSWFFSFTLTDSFHVQNIGANEEDFRFALFSFFLFVSLQSCCKFLIVSFTLFNCCAGNEAEAHTQQTTM